jgi:hypothetical protein
MSTEMKTSERIKLMQLSFHGGIDFAPEQNDH